MTPLELALSTDRLFRRFYYDVPTFVDGTSEFHSICRKYLEPGSKILEIGSGPSNATSQFLSGIGPVAGVDVSNEVLQNEWLSDAHVYDGRRLPFADASFSACVSDYVVEHIGDAEEHFREVARVLRPGGVYCFRTPNLWHYVAFSARLLPHVFHRRMANRLRGLSSEAHEPYRTQYKANTAAAVRRISSRVGMEVLDLTMAEKEPSYGRAHILLFLPMLAYERAVNKWSALSGMRANIFGVVQKPAVVIDGSVVGEARSA